MRADGYKEVCAQYAAKYPHLENRVFRYHPRRHLKGKLAYAVFLSNAYRFIGTAERYNLPFVFTLYPGGGFKLNTEKSDARLRRVCSSPSFEKVIVTQSVSRDYLLDGGFCGDSKIEYIYGVVTPAAQLNGRPVQKQYYPSDKATFDICFVAHKYMPRGVDKGYDVFVEVARSLAQSHDDIRFHVVGGFDASDVDVTGMEDRFTFYGRQNTDFFRAFYARMDIILSPNVPFVLAPGAFDGFPTGSCTEAGLCGVAVFCTDELHQNIAFLDGEEIVLIPPDAEQICRTIRRYRADYAALYALARKGQQAFQRVFSLENQLDPRLETLSRVMEGVSTSAV